MNVTKQLASPDLLIATNEYYLGASHHADVIELEKTCAPLFLAITLLFSLVSVPATALEFKNNLFDIKTETEIRLHSYHNTTINPSGLIDTEHDTFISKIELATELHYNNWFFNNVIEANDLSTDDEEPFFVSEFYLGYNFNLWDIYTGRFSLPFGYYKKSFISDHITKKLGKTNTKNGLAIVRKQGNFKWVAAGFTDNFRSSDPDKNGFTINVNWTPTDSVLVGGGYLSSRKATQGQPQLLNLYGRVMVSQWTVVGEYVGAISKELDTGNKPSVFTIEAKYTLTKSFAMGGRYQNTHAYNIINGGKGNYKETALTSNYHFNKYVTLSIEYAQGKEQSSELVYVDKTQFTSQIRVLF